MIDIETLDPFVGEWDVAVDHPHIDGTVTGRMIVERLERGGYLIQRSVMEDPVFPAAIAIIGPDAGGERLVQHYFDSRGVARVYDIALADGVLTIERSGADQDFAQRYVGRFSDDGATIEGTIEIDQDGTGLVHDFDLTYRRTA